MWVSKRDVNGREVWGYPARLLVRGAHCVRLEAFFDRPDTWLHGMLLGRGDRFVETFYSDRWYNIFEIHARQDDALRGQYCNVGYPAVLGAEVISYRDLALDLLVFPDGRQVVLDEDEFAALPPEHDAHDGRHDEVRFGSEGGDAPDEEFGDDQEPDQEEVELIEREGDCAQFRIRFHWDNKTEQGADGDESGEDEGNPFPLEIAIPNVADKVHTEKQGKLDEQKRAHPDFGAAFFQLAAQGF